MAIVRMIDLLDDFLAHWKEREKKDPTIKLGDDERIGATLFAQWYDNRREVPDQENKYELAVQVVERLIMDMTADECIICGWCEEEKLYGSHQERDCPLERYVEYIKS